MDLAACGTGPELGRVTGCTAFGVMMLFAGEHDGFDGHCADLVPMHHDCTFSQFSIAVPICLNLAELLPLPKLS